MNTEIAPSRAVARDRRKFGLELATQLLAHQNCEDDPEEAFSRAFFVLLKAANHPRGRINCARVLLPVLVDMEGGARICEQAEQLKEKQLLEMTAAMEEDEDAESYAECALAIANYLDEQRVGTPTETSSR